MTSNEQLSAADRARMRRERREQKIREGGSARLGKITGGVGAPDKELPSTRVFEDPPEVDISEGKEAKGFTDPLNMFDISQLQGRLPFGNTNLGGGLQQTGPDPFGFFDNMATDTQSKTAVQSEANVMVWRAVHFTLAVVFSIVLVTMLPRSPMFWSIAVFELVFQSTRLLLEKGGAPSGSILSTIGAQLPPPFGSYLTLFARYSLIWTNFMDALCIFLLVLGVSSLS